MSGLSVAPSVWGWEKAHFKSSLSESPNDVRIRPDEASNDGSTSKLMSLDPCLGTDRLDEQEEECSAGFANSSVWGLGCASSCVRIKGSDEARTPSFFHKSFPSQRKYRYWAPGKAPWCYLHWPPLLDADLHSAPGVSDGTATVTFAYCAPPQVLFDTFHPVLPGFVHHDDSSTLSSRSRDRHPDNLNFCLT